MLKFTTSENDARLDAFLYGDLDIEGTEVMNEELIPVLLNYETINVSFEEVPFVDSSGMGLLISLVKTLKEENISITISDVKGDVLEVFELLQITEILGEGVLV